MDNFKCLIVFYCDVLNKKDTIVSVDLFEACERNLQDFSLSQKIGVIPQMHSVSHEFSSTKTKTRAIWVRKDSLRLVLLTCPWFNSSNYLWTRLLLVFGCFIFLGCFDYSKIQKHWKVSKRQKIFYFVSCFICFEDYMSYNISLLI